MKTILFLIALSCSCITVINPEYVDNSSEPTTIETLTDSGYTDIVITGECLWSDCCETCFNTGFIAKRNDSVVAGNVCLDIMTWESVINLFE